LRGAAFTLTLFPYTTLFRSVKFQRELCAAVTVPVFTSSLLLVPLVHRMLAPRRRVGILTVNAGTLTPEHLEGAGVGPDIPIAVADRKSTRLHSSHGSISYAA